VSVNNEVDKLESAILEYLEAVGRATLTELRHTITREPIINAAIINLINEKKVDRVIIGKKRYYAKRRS
jgi:hypothetical protein